MKTRVTHWMYEQGIRHYCHREDLILWWWQRCPHKPRFWPNLLR
jgi:hypothetical protein